MTLTDLALRQSVRSAYAPRTVAACWREHLQYANWGVERFVEGLWYPIFTCFEPTALIGAHRHCARSGASRGVVGGERVVCCLV
jgi:hypothetical protein